MFECSFTNLVVVGLNPLTVNNFFFVYFQSHISAKPELSQNTMKTNLVKGIPNR